MKKLSITISLIVLTSVLHGQAVCDGQQVVVTADGQCNYNPWVLVFEDNFDGNSLDLSKWQIQPWGQGALQGDNSIEYNSLDNVSVSNGICYITAKKETVVRRAVSWKPDNEILDDGLPNLRTYNYTSSNIWTKSKFSHGKYEIRCKIPNGKGFWPAFWMFGSGPNEENNEIDVFEFWNNNTTDHNMNVHYNGQMCLTDYNGPDYSQSFHTFTVIWDNYKIAWYVDGDLKRLSTKFYTMLGQVVDCNGIQAWTQYIMDKVYPRDPMNIIVNLALQSGTYEPDANTPFPSSLEIDYIRYYKQMPCDGTVNATDISDLNLSNDVYNVVIGTTINLSGNVTVQSGQQLELVARDVIVLGPGFTAEAGSDFVARIDPSICVGVQKTGNIPSNSTTTDSLSYIEKSSSENQVIKAEKNCKVRIFPNPTEGKFSIEFEQDSFNTYDLYIIDEQGKVVYSLKSVNTPKVEIDVNSYSKGLYFINLLDTKNKIAYTHKIVKD